MRGIAAGGYTVLAVSDSGIGMSPETAARAFEPFFTTKDMGKGTGLGLSMVYGFAKQSKGHVEIASTIGLGTTVRIFLPRLAVCDARNVPDLDQPAMRDAGGHGETILVVEDDAEVRLYVADILRVLNYRVIDVADARSALDALAQPSLPIDLLLTDVVMPGLDGRELAQRAATMRKGLKVLFMTGYSQNAIIHQGRLDPDVELIEKPFGRESLAARVRGILDAYRDIQAAAR